MRRNIAKRAHVACLASPDRWAGKLRFERDDDLPVHNRNLRGGGNWHQNRAMRRLGKTGVGALVCAMAAGCVFAQQASTADNAAQSSHVSKTAKDRASKANAKHKGERALSSDERLAVIASALDSKTPRYAERDCSHLVHAIYERAGFPYAYADSDDLYDGIEGFQRVSKPQTGDLVVWRGHAGIVIRPSRHVFFSFLHAGPGTDDYQSAYWKRRGEARFYRYLKEGGWVARSRGD